MSRKINSVDLTCKNWLPWQHTSRDQNTNLRSFIYSHTSTNPENLVKIGPVDVKISDLTEIAEKEINNKQRQNIKPPLVAADKVS